jgi:predicted tellurium resistance membrane protein TerC
MPPSRFPPSPTFGDSSMGLAASFIARLLEKHRWVAYVGLVIILYVAFDMCYRGALEVWQDVKA